MEIQRIIGFNIRAFRQWRVLSQEELGKKANLHRAYISAVERGERNISVENLNKIAKALDVECHILLLEGVNKWIK